MADVERTWVRPSKEKRRWRFSRPNGLSMEGEALALQAKQDCAALQVFTACLEKCISCRAGVAWMPNVD